MHLDTNDILVLMMIWLVSLMSVIKFISGHGLLVTIYGDGDPHFKKEKRHPFSKDSEIFVLFES